MTPRSNAQLQQNTVPVPEEKIDYLQIVTCGSVDAGKSTLMGRLLYDSQLLYEDQIETLQKDTTKYSDSMNKEYIDFSLLLDGLQDEREQGITIDLAYRFFQIGSRRFILADAPGHEQYTKNMAAGASNSALGIIVVDSEKGILPQTKRHTHILYLMGIQHFVLCINKMDMVNYSEEIFREISFHYEKLIKSFEPNSNKFNLYSIPVSAVQGDNITYKSNNMKWYTGESLVSYLNGINLIEDNKEDFIMPVQLVSRSAGTERCYMGTIVGGKINIGETIKILPSQQESKVKQIIAFNDKSRTSALQGEATALVLENDIDIVRGDLIVKNDSFIKIADYFRIKLLCLEDEPLYSSRSYLFKFAHRIVLGTLSDIKKIYDAESSVEQEKNGLNVNEFGECEVHLSQKIPFTPYEDNKTLGSCLVIDRISKKTLGVGMILFDLRRSHTLFPCESNVSKSLRSQLKRQKPCVLWFTGLSGAGKTTIANIVEGKLFSKGYHTYFIDGDSIRNGINSDLGFKDSDRIENVRRMGYLSKYFVDAGLITLVAAISPFEDERNNIRSLFDPSEFIEIYVQTSLETCIKRDPKKIYEKYSQGEVVNLSGLDSPYEKPLNPEITIDTDVNSAEILANQIVDYFLKQQN